MSWGRIDDSFWDHEKTIALIEQGPKGLEAVGAFWVIVSYLYKVHRNWFSIWDAVMLMRRPVHEVQEVLARLEEAPEGWDRGFLLPKKCEAGPGSNVDLLRQQTRSWEVNSLEEYRGKNKAKVTAGKQGGVNSGKSRRSKAKAKREAEDVKQADSPKQTLNPRSPIPDPRIPDPRSYCGVEKVLKHYLGVNPDNVIQADQEGATLTIRKRLQDGYTAEQLCLAIDGNKLDTWYAGKKLHGVRDVFKDARTIDRFIAKASEATDPTPKENEFERERRLANERERAEEDRRAGNA